MLFTYATPAVHVACCAVLLVPANDMQNETSYLLIISAQTMEVVAKVRAPADVNLGLHNLFLPDPEYSAWRIKN